MLWNLGWLRFNNALFIEDGYLKIFALTGMVLLLSHGFDLYDSAQLGAKLDQAFRLLFVLGLVALALAGLSMVYRQFLPGQYFLPGRGSELAGLAILTCALLGWRSAYSWLVQQPFFRERVYVLGTGDRAERLMRGLRQRSGLGIEVVGWTGNLSGELTREMVAEHLVSLVHENGVHRVIVAMPNRRGTLPVDELLESAAAKV